MCDYESGERSARHAIPPQIAILPVRMGRAYLGICVGMHIAVHHRQQPTPGESVVSNRVYRVTVQVYGRRHRLA